LEKDFELAMNKSDVFCFFNLAIQPLCVKILNPGGLKA